MEEKTLGYDWEFGHEEIILKVADYYYGHGLAVLMFTKEDEGLTQFCDLTVNLSGYSLEPNEAFISGDLTKDKLQFIRQNKLGKVLSEKGKSGFCTYTKVAFDLDRLAEFDKEGVERFREMHGIEASPKRVPKKKKKEKER
ncbi:DUF4313 domain-containing protein [Mediterraneibacter gnavus]|uniref:DUF4313 domain-containing protein n=1 Tax=Mediterraneibacter gnavus TaxID=33038 RepID=UPI003562ECAE